MTRPALDRSWGCAPPDFAATTVTGETFRLADPRGRPVWLTALASRYRVLGPPTHLFIGRDGTSRTIRLGGLAAGKRTT
jgi:hypothetical protein